MQTGADGEEHTTRTVSAANESSESEGFDGDNLINAILAPLMGGMPDIERIMQDSESVAEEPAAPKVEAKVVSKDQAQQAVKTAISAQGLEYDSPEKRQVSFGNAYCVFSTSSLNSLFLQHWCQALYLVIHPPDPFLPAVNSFKAPLARCSRGAHDQSRIAT